MTHCPHFNVTHSSGYARAGTLKTAHGEVQTPVFMPVGTLGTVKTTTPEELIDFGSQIILGNTYHLFLRPGLEVLKKFGGLHNFMNWQGPLLTDSGGFQVFSLGQLKKLSQDGVTFKSHLDGSEFFLSPEKSAEIQQVIGSDIAMVLDECVALPNTPAKIREAVDRSAVWADRFLKYPRKEGQLIFGINQGGTLFSERERSLELTLKLPIDGFAIGGLSVGEPHAAMVEVLDFLAPKLPPELPHYLMGVGTPLDLLEAVNLGVDMFDCVLPTRNARHGSFFTDDGLLNLKNSRYKLDEEALEPGDLNSPIKNYSKAYLRHLIQAKEILGCRLATAHNLHYYHRLMRDMRTAIVAGNWESFYQAKRTQFRKAYGSAQ